MKNPEPGPRGRDPAAAGEPPVPALELEILDHLRGCWQLLHHKNAGKGGQRRILAILRERGDMTQRELMDHAGMRSASLSEILGKIEQSGYIERRQNREDRRSVDVRLTDAGREAAERMQGHYRGAVVPRLFDCLSGEEKRQLALLLEKLHTGWQTRDRERARLHGQSGNHPGERGDGPPPATIRSEE